MPVSCIQSDEHYVNLIVNYLKNNSDDDLKKLFLKEKLVPEVDSNTQCPSQPIHVYVSDIQLTQSSTCTHIWDFPCAYIAEAIQRAACYIMFYKLYTLGYFLWLCKQKSWFFTIEKPLCIQQTLSRWITQTAKNNCWSPKLLFYCIKINFINTPMQRIDSKNTSTKVCREGSVCLLPTRTWWQGLCCRVE